MAVVGGHPQVTIREIDLSVRVPGFPGVYGAIVIPAKRGPIDEPQLITSETQLLRKFTPDEKIEVGYDLGYFSAAAFLQKANKLWVKRAIGDGYLHSGAVLKGFTVSGDSNDTLVTGEEDPEAYTFGLDEAVLIHAADPGEWADDFGFRLWLQRNREDVLLGATGAVSPGTPTAATGVIDPGGEDIVVDATLAAGANGNVAISFSDDPAPVGIKAITSIQITMDEAGFSGGEYIEISTPYEDFYAWTTKNAGGVDPVPGGTSLGVYDVTTQAAASGTIDPSGVAIGVDATLVAGSAGNVTVSIVDDVTQYGTQAIISIAILQDETGFAGAEWIGISTPYEDFYVWTTKDGAGVDPAPGGRTLLGVYDVTTGVDTQATIADGLAGIINANAGFVCPTTASGTVLATAVRTGVALSVPDGSAMPTQATVTETTPGVDSGVSVTYNVGLATIDVILEDLQTPASAVKAALEAELVIDIVDLNAVPVTDGWQVAWLGCVLSNGVDGDTAITIANALGALIDANAGFVCPVSVTSTVLATAERTGIALSIPSGAGMPANVSETVAGVNSGVTATYDSVAHTIDVILEDLQTPASAVKAAIEAIVVIDTVDLNVTPVNDGWDLLWLGVTLTGGISDTNTITVTQFFASGEPIRFSKSASGSDVMPIGIVENTTYYTIEVDDTTIKLAPTQTDALAGTSEVDIIDAGTGTMVLVPLVDIKEPGGIQIEVYKRSNENYPVEQWIVSRTPGAKNGLGNNMFIEDMLEGSNYIRAVDNALVLETLRPQVTVLYLGGGNDGADMTDGKMVLAADAYNDPAGFIITVLMDGGWATPTYQTALKNIAENRHDCVAILSVPYDKEASANYINEIVDYRRTILNMSSSFAAMYTPHVKIYDKFNDRYLYVSPDGYAGAAISFTAYNYEMWYPVAGFKRGNLSVLDTRRRFTKGELDFLYDNDLNPNRFYPGKGINIWGQKTLYGQPSALDRLNVRLLLVVLEPAIALSLESFLFDLNDVATRKLVKAMIDDYMEGVKGRRGVYEFYTQCDEDNNTTTDIDNHILNVHLFIKPTLSVEYIPLTICIMRTGLSLQLAQQTI